MRTINAELMDLVTALDELRGRNPILADAMQYYMERRGMANPKGWAHVCNTVQRALYAGVYKNCTEGEISEATTLLNALWESEDE